MAEQGLLSSLRASIRERKTVGELRKFVTITDAKPDAGDDAGEADGDDA